MSTSRAANSFEGQLVYVGLDVHKSSWQVSIVLQHVNQKTFHLAPGDPQALKTYLETHYPGGVYRCAYEAGFCGFWICEQLTQLGITTQVYHASDIPTNDKEKRQKTDARDSLKIAKALRQGDTEGLYVPDAAQQALRSLVRYAAALSKDRQRVMHRIKSHLDFYGRQAPALGRKTGWSVAYLTWLKGLAETDRTLHGLLEQLTTLRALERATFKQGRAALAAQPYNAPSDLLRSVPGIGVKNALVLLSELGLDWKRFRTLDKLAAYCGLMPDTNSSGDTVRVGDLTRRGNGRLRKLLIESAWVTIRYDAELGAAYNAYRTRMISQKAIIKVARRLLNRLRHVMLHQERYTPQTKPT